MSCQIPLAMQLTFKYRINIERVEIRVERPGQTEIVRNKRTPFRGVPRFLFQSVQTDITVPFAQIFYFHLICYLFALLSINFSDLQDCKRTTEKKVFAQMTKPFIPFRKES